MFCPFLHAISHIFLYAKDANLAAQRGGGLGRGKGVSHWWYCTCSTTCIPGVPRSPPSSSFSSSTRRLLSPFFFDALPVCVWALLGASQRECYGVHQKKWNSTTIKTFFSLIIEDPTNYARLINFRLISNAEILLGKKAMPNVQKRVCNRYIFRLSFHFAHHCWWLGRQCGVLHLFLLDTQCWYNNEEERERERERYSQPNISPLLMPLLQGGPSKNIWYNFTFHFST